MINKKLKNNTIKTKYVLKSFSASQNKETQSLIKTPTKISKIKMLKNKTYILSNPHVKNKNFAT